MAFQLLTGRLPFNDKRNPHTPVLSAVLRSIMTETLDFERSYWQGISEEGKDFVRFVLERDPERRPTAAEALQHAWLRGDVRDRRRGAQLSLNVVQRIQRFGRLDYLKRSLLELMAAELANEDAAPVRPAACCALTPPHAHCCRPQSGSPALRGCMAARCSQPAVVGVAE